MNAIPGIDFSSYPQIMAAPPVPAPADYFALTRTLVVPSVWEEPFARVAAEAMINGIPALVSNRGSLPDVVAGDFSTGGGGRVLPIPAWMTAKTTDVPGESEIEPWYRAVCELWDNPGVYSAVGARARHIAEARYSESGLAEDARQCQWPRGDCSVGSSPPMESDASDANAISIAMTSALERIEKNS